MRNINLIVIHCSDSDYSQHDNISTLREWHVGENGWSDIGYHYFIQKNGRINICRPVHKPGAHAKEVNKSSIGICLSGKDPKRFTAAQFDSLNSLLLNMIRLFDLDIMDVVGHCEITSSGKTCPNISMDIVRQKLLIYSNQKG